MVSLLDGSSGIVNFPTTYGFLLARILLKNNETDLDLVHRYQAGITLVNMSRPVTFDPSPPLLNMDLLNGSLTGSATEKSLEVTARLAPYNIPSNSRDMKPVAEILEKAGIKGGNYTAPQPAANLTLAQSLYNQSIFESLSSSDYKLNLGNGWVTGSSRIAGCVS